MTDEPWSMHARREGSDSDDDGRTIQLPDGSTVGLGSDTRVEIEYGPDGREVMLDVGKAEFHVVYRAGQQFKVWIGRVCVCAMTGNFAVTLSADGQQVTVCPHDSTVEIVIYTKAKQGRCVMKRTRNDSRSMLSKSKVSTSTGGTTRIFTRTAAQS